MPARTRAKEAARRSAAPNAARRAAAPNVARRLAAPNNVQRLREEQLLTKAELARRAGISPLTISRIESGLDCRVDTKRKIILALGLTPSDRRKVFGPALVRARAV
jgi:DNA-binding XRE family transcriptional regulator